MLGGTLSMFAFESSHHPGEGRGSYFPSLFPPRHDAAGTTPQSPQEQATGPPSFTDSSAHGVVDIEF
jgi:hypothetical protein